MEAEQPVDIWSKIIPPSTCASCGWRGVPPMRRAEIKFRLGFMVALMLIAVPVMSGLLPVGEINAIWVVGPAMLTWLIGSFGLRHLARCGRCGSRVR